MAKSVKTNYVLTLFDIVVGIAFPLVTLPYVTRILSPGSIGHVHFYLNILSYITLITSLGIPLYGVREIAKKSNNVKERNRSAIELFILHLLLTAIGYLVVFILGITVDKIKEDLFLFSLLSISMFFTTIGVSWFFQGVEDFKYVTVRSLIVKLLSLVLLLSLVKNKDDVLWYGFVLICGSVGNNIFNFIRLNKYLTRDDFNKSLNPFRHIRPSSKVFVLNLTIGIYTQLSVFLLGFIQSDDAVGYYTMPQRIVAVLNSVVLALTTVLLPKLSSYIGNNQQKEFKTLGNKALSFVLAISLPICVALVILSRPIIMLLFGYQYEKSITVLNIWAPILVAIGLSQIYGKSILYSKGHELLMTISTITGMVVFLIIAIPGVLYYSIIGASIASLMAEFSVTITMMYLGRKKHPCTMFRKENAAYVIACFIMAVPMIICTNYINNYFWQLCLGVILGIITYMIVLDKMHDLLYFEIIDTIKRIWKNQEMALKSVLRQSL